MLDEAGALAALMALAQETRLRIVRTLLHALPEGIPAGRLAAAVGCAPSTLTFHLRQLQEAGLVESRRQGALVIYSARPAGVTGLTDYLTQSCCGGRPEACLPVPAPRCGDAASPPPQAAAYDATHALDAPAGTGRP
ncbi:metalloregulator ArsR/SmtB family transcription factor [Methylobacterium currus]|uniref:ArsR/SmtB family transcription factor n=1 Tax=Methylobacterium currus TaxID=2051553 RepID=UPI001E5D9BB9|nr:metalloregulator ArsR/SmtB family transcription factor [Methylobacterium currus]UHC18320.1 metalloregulator ArsR/SmtB family transcription factor [Methylobacterium currus]